MDENALAEIIVGASVFCAGCSLDGAGILRTCAWQRLKPRATLLNERCDSKHKDSYVLVVEHVAVNGVNGVGVVWFA